LEIKIWKIHYYKQVPFYGNQSHCSHSWKITEIHACFRRHPTNKEAVWASSISAQWHSQSDAPFMQLIAFYNVEFLRLHSVGHSMNSWSLYQCHEDSSCLVRRSCSQLVPPLDKWLAHLLGIGLSVSNV